MVISLFKATNYRESQVDVSELLPQKCIRNSLKCFHSILRGSQTYQSPVKLSGTYELIPSPETCFMVFLFFLDTQN